MHKTAVGLELFFGGGEDAPDFVAFFLDGEGMEAHLEAGEDGHEGGRASDGDAAAGLDLGLETGAADDLGVEVFGRQEHDGVGHRGGRVDVLVTDTLAFGTDGALEGTASSGDFFRRTMVIGMFEALPVFFGKLGVDGQESIGVGAFTVGEFERILDGLQGVGFDAGVLDVLLGGEHLLELLAELELADDAAGPDVGEDFFQVANTGGELLHFAEAFLDFAEVSRHLTEGFGKAGLQCGVEFFVYGDAHLFELGGVVLVEFGEAVFDGEAQLFLLAVRFAGKLVKATVEGFAGFELVAVDLGDEIGETLRDGVEVLLDGGAEDLVGSFVIGAEAVEAGVEEVAELGDVVGDLAAEVGEGGGCGFAGAAGLGRVVGAELGEFVTEMVVERLGAGIETDNLRGECVGELNKAGILLRGRGFAHEKEDNGDE